MKWSLTLQWIFQSISVNKSLVNLCNVSSNAFVLSVCFRLNFLLSHKTTSSRLESFAFWLMLIHRMPGRIFVCKSKQKNLFSCLKQNNFEVSTIEKCTSKRKQKKANKCYGYAAWSSDVTPSSLNLTILLRISYCLSQKHFPNENSHFSYHEIPLHICFWRGFLF